MKQFLFLTFFIPFFAWSQDDSIYLEGAVPMENGKVVFTKVIPAASLEQTEVFDSMLAWAKSFVEGTDSRIVYTNREQGDIAIAGKENLVFQSTALALDQAQMDYRATIQCKKENCTLKISGIRYVYNVSYRKEPERYTAEEWISDKYALNKSKTKLNRGNAKFRRKTVDFISKTFASAVQIPVFKPLQAAIEPERAPMEKQTEYQTKAEVPQSPKGDYVAVAPDKIPATLLRMLPESRMEVATGTTGETEKKAVWKGSGHLLGKTIASIAIDKNSTVYKSIGEKTPYTLSFFKERDEHAWLIVDCRKQGETDDSGQATLIGEILTIWIK